MSLQENSASRMPAAQELDASQGSLASSPEQPASHKSPAVSRQKPGGSHETPEIPAQKAVASQGASEDASARVTRLKKRLGYDASAITVALLAELGVTGIAEVVLFPLVSDRVHHLLRSQVRHDHDEQVATAQEQARQQQARRERAGSSAVVRPQSVPTPDLSDSSLAFLEFKVIMAGVPNGFKLYKDLTIEEHEARRLMLLKTAEPVLRSARGHEWAAELCRKHETWTLAEIGSETLAAELPEGGIRP
jgi:hypothetical protein